MSKTENRPWMVTGIASKFPTYRKSKFITTYSWQMGKIEDDQAEGLWRIHDNLYDFTEFIDRHPGGSFWIKESQGTDITEAFEAHHISLGPEKMIAKYRVREAKAPRIYNLTIKDGGFYKTLKSRVRTKLKEIDYKPTKISDLIHTGLLAATFALAIGSAYFQSNILGVLAGIALCWNTIAAHNYFHRKDNWRMYTFNLSLMNFYGWRISHALSHHIYPNSLLDLELSMFEPFLCWLPSKYFKTNFQRYFSILAGPVVYMLTFLSQIVVRIAYSLKRHNIMYWHDIIGLSIPLAMLILSDLSLFMVIKKWLFLNLVGSFCFAAIGLNAAHHEPEIYHDGDAVREDRDWGLFQVDTITDRSDLKGSQFLTLTHFGDHALHHLFPTLDHGILPQLYPALYETLSEFKGELREIRYLEHIIGQHKQLLRIKPNKIPPGSGK
ncbi:cytochrome b5-related protein [Eupeodes corollae]|uniref:cytochrome b5-related protein n=1 Tax=Eupeodes corollae TaxID=290404 RepID=UPI0024904DA9|nr:cytochrome b5-related protein [Eupeodes corollae]